MQGKARKGRDMPSVRFALFAKEYKELASRFDDLGRHFARSYQAKQKRTGIS